MGKRGPKSGHGGRPRGGMSLPSGFKTKKEYAAYMRRYRARRKAKIAELKRLASQHITFMSGVELAEKIRDL